MLATDQAIPIFDYEPLEDIVEEPKISTGQHAEQVPVEVPEDLAEVKGGRMSRLRWEHASQHLPQRPRPISEHGNRRAVDFHCGCKVRRREWPLLPAQSVFSSNGADKEDKP
jgi:hypothetical protein